MNGGEIVNAEAISAAVRTLIDEVKSRRKYINVGLFGTAVIVKQITIPKIEKKLIAEQIKWEAEQYIPFDINSITLAYHVIESRSFGDTMDLLLVAAQNEIVYQYTNVVVQTKLNLACLDVSGFALANCFESNYGQTPGQSYVLINIGSSVTNFVGIQNGDVTFSRDIPVGGTNYTNEIHKEMGVSTTEAEALKISAVSRGEVPDEVHSILSATNDVVAEEIRNSFEFFVSSNQGLTVSNLFYSGGASVMPGLMERIGSSTGVTLEPINPFIRTRAKGKWANPTSLQQISRFCPVAIGLALRKVGDS